MLDPIKIIILLDPSPVEVEVAALDALQGVAVSRIDKSSDEDEMRRHISQGALQASLRVLPEISGNT